MVSRVRKNAMQNPSSSVKKTALSMNMSQPSVHRGKKVPDVKSEPSKKMSPVRKGVDLAKMLKKSLQKG